MKATKKTQEEEMRKLDDKVIIRKRNKTYEGVVTQINRKTDEVTVWQENGFFIVRIPKKKQ